MDYSFIEMITLGILALIVIFFTHLTLKIHRVIQKHKDIPGPPASGGILGFYFGNVFDIIKAQRNGIGFTDFFAQTLRDYGPTAKLRFIDYIYVLTVDKDLLKTVFIDENFPKERKTYTALKFSFGERYMGHSALTELDYEKWKTRRAFMNPGFHRKSLMTFMHEFNVKTDVLMNHLRLRADGKTPLNLLDYCNRATLDIISSVGFSMPMDSVNDPTNKFSKYVKMSIDGVFQNLRNPFFKYIPFNWPYIIKYRHGVREIRRFGREIILSRIDALKNDGHIPNDILTTILSSSRRDELQIEELVDEFVSLFVGGQETTASSIAFAFRELARNRHVLLKARQEVDNVIGSKTYIEYADLLELKYLTAVFKETLRWYPVIPIMGREAPKDIVLEKFTIPKGTQVTPNAMVAAQNEDAFPDAKSFKPERFLDDDNNEHRSPYVYFPFSLGPRNCIGQNMAQIEAKVIIAKFIQNFDFTLDPTKKIGEDMRGTLQPVDGTTCFLTLRSS